MSEPQRVAGFMQRDAEYVQVRPDSPSLGVIEMLMSRDRFRVQGIGIKGVRQDGCARKWIIVAMRAVCK